MKRFKIWSIIAVLAIAFLGYSCDDDDERSYVICKVKVTLSYDNGTSAKEGVVVKARATDAASEFEKTTDATGSVVFDLPSGSYEFSATDITGVGKNMFVFNGLKKQIIGDYWLVDNVITLKMNGSNLGKSSLIIKEIYQSGCPGDDGDVYSFGQYMILYNNSAEDVDLKDLCFGSCITNSNSVFLEFTGEGDKKKKGHYWFDEDWTPVAMGFFYFPNSVIVKPFQQVVVSITGAIDHTAVHSQCVDLSKAEYYAMYDVEVFDNKNYYPAPSANIPTNHYLKAVRIPNALGNAVTGTTTASNYFLFYPKGQTPEEFATQNTDLDYWRNLPNFPRLKVPSGWVVDAIDAFRNGFEDKNEKRVNPKADAGYVYVVNDKGYTLYRNVNKAATEAIPGNKEKLVYKYAMGTEDVEEKHGTTDPSGIDAEASMANGATIIYMDTNNSGKDFHLRKKSSLRK